MKSVCVVAKVLAVRKLYAYPSCSKCRRKLLKREDKNRYCCSPCKKSYDIDSIQYRFYVTLNVADGSGMAVVTIFGRSLQAFFGLTATQFCRYVIKCENDQLLQGINVGHTVRLSMEKCFVGSMVHLLFSITTDSCAKDCNRSTFLLNNLVLAKTCADSAVSESHCNDYRSKPRQLLASCIFRINEQKHGTTVADIFTEYIKSYKEALTNVSDNITKSVHSIEDVRTFLEDPSNVCPEESTLDKTCESQVNEAPWFGMKYQSGTDLVLTFDSESINTKEDELSAIDGERSYKDDVKLKKISPSDNVAGTLPKLSRVFGLGDLQQSFVYATSSDIPQMWTDFTEADVSTVESVTSDFYCSATLCQDSNTIHTDTKTRPCWYNLTNTHHLGDAHACHVNDVISQQSSQEWNTKAENLEQVSCTSNTCLDTLLDSPSTEDIDAFLADIDLQCFESRCDKHDSMQLYRKEGPVGPREKSERSKSQEFSNNKKRRTLSNPVVHDDKIPGSKTTVCHCVNSEVYSCTTVGTPELFSPDTLVKRRSFYHKPCLSSTPISQCSANCHVSLVPNDNYHITGGENKNLNFHTPVMSKDKVRKNETSPLFPTKSQIYKLSPVYMSPNDVNSCVTPVNLKVPCDFGNKENKHCGKSSIKKTKLDDRDSMHGTIENTCSPLLFSQT